MGWNIGVMARRPKRSITEAKPNTFADAIAFVGSILKDAGAPNETHIHLANKQVTAFNGILAAGINIEEDIYAFPQYKLFSQALSKCEDIYSITQLDVGRLSVKSNKFKAVIPCVDPNILVPTIPDPSMDTLNDSFRLAIEAVGVLSVENAQRVVEASILNTGQSVIASNGKVIFEYWHGLNLPIGLTIPKAFVKPLADTKKKIVSFGYSQSSFTIYFEDSSWLRSQLFAEQWPAIGHILDVPAKPLPVPAAFWEGLSAVAPFSEHGDIYLSPGMLRSHNTEGIGASFEVEGLPGGLIYPARQLALLRGWATAIDFNAQGSHGSRMLMAYGDKMRGVIAGRVGQ